jgi:putative serine protease PepD
METPFAPHGSETPTAPPMASPSARVHGPADWTPPTTPATAPPATPSTAGSSRPRARFGAGLVVGAAVTAAALGGYVVGENDGTAPVAEPAPAVGAPLAADPAPGAGAQPVVTETGAIGDLVAAARPSVVLVEQQIEQAGRFGGSTGTGFVLSSDGYIVTNDHVVAGGDQAVVTFDDGSTEVADVVAADPSRDLAVLQVSRTDLQPLAVGDSDSLRLGDQLVAVGYALGLDGEPSVTSGILSARDRTIVVPSGEQLVNLLQTDTAINPGNSGGPLLNMNGEVVGINTAVAGQAQNIGFAIAITPVMDIIADLRQGNVPARALLGVTTQPAADGPGAEVVDIAPGSGAAASDLRIGDVITAVDGDAVTDPSSLGAVIASQRPGDVVTVTVERGGSSVDVEVTLGTRPT